MQRTHQKHHDEYRHDNAEHDHHRDYLNPKQPLHGMPPFRAVPALSRARGPAMKDRRLTRSALGSRFLLLLYHRFRSSQYQNARIRMLERINRTMCVPFSSLRYEFRTLTVPRTRADALATLRPVHGSSDGAAAQMRPAPQRPCPRRIRVSTSVDTPLELGYNFTSLIDQGGCGDRSPGRRG
jgi:hypothetical protein